MNMHVQASPIRAIVWPLAISRCKLECLKEAYSKEIHLGPAQNLAHTTALSCAKVDDPLIRYKLSLCINESLRLEGGWVLEELGIMEH